MALEIAATELGHLLLSFNFESVKHSEASVGEEEENEGIGPSLGGIEYCLQQPRA